MPKTSFDRYFAEQMKNPGFARLYNEARADVEIRQVILESDVGLTEDAVVQEVTRRLSTNQHFVRIIVQSMLGGGGSLFADDEGYLHVKICRHSANDMLKSFTHEKVTVAGYEFTVSMPSLRCDVCDETLTHMEHGMLMEQLIAVELLSCGVVTGESMRYARKAAGLKAEDLAAMCASTWVAVCDWEDGDSKPRLYAASVLLAVLLDQLGQRGTTQHRLTSLLAKDVKPRLRISIYAPSHFEMSEEEDDDES